MNCFKGIKIYFHGKILSLYWIASLLFVCLIILRIQSTQFFSRRLHIVRNGENCKMHKIDWCEGGLQLSDIVTKNVVDND